MMDTTSRRLRAALLCGAAPWLMTTAHAQTEIDDGRTTPVVTSADGAVTITEGGRITLTDGGADGVGVVAITIDSDDDVSNGGEVVIEGEADGNVGVLITGDRAAGFTQSGSIIIESAVVPERNEAAPALPAGRYGVLLADDARLTGDITFEAGAGITVDGDGAAGVAILGDLLGDLDLGGGIDVRGVDAAAVLIGGAVSGDVTLAGREGAQDRLTALGEGTSGLVVADGASVAGRLTVQREIVVTPLTNDTRFTSDGNTDDDLDRDEQRALRGGNALRIAGDVDGGVLIGGASAAVEDDEMNVITPALRGATLLSRVGGPTVLFDGGAVIGALADAEDTEEASDEAGFGFYNGGIISAAPEVIGVSSTAVSIQDATLIGGMANAGTINAVSSGLDSDAVAITFGADAVVSRFVNTSGTGITASARSDEGDAIAFRDESGTVTTFVNSGAITASLGDFTDPNPCLELDDPSDCPASATDAATRYDRGVPTGDTIAVDLSANTSGVDFDSTGLIRGDVRLGTGDDDVLIDGTDLSTTIVLNGDLSTGAGDDTLRFVSALVSGDVSLGDGFDTVSIEDGVVSGALDFGEGGGTFALSGGAGYQGGLDAALVDVTVGDLGSQIFLDRVGANPVGSLTTLASGGDLLDENGQVVRDGAGAALQRDPAALTFTVSQTGDGFSFFDVAGDAIIADDTEFRTVFGAAFDERTISQPIIRAGGLLDVDLSGGRTPDALGLTPFLFTQELSIDEDENALVLTLQRKTAEEVGLNQGLAPAYEPFITALATASDPSLGDTGRAVGRAIFNLTDEESFLGAYRQFLPTPLEAPLTYARAQNSSVTSLVTQRVDALREDTGGQRTFWLQEESYFVNRGADELSNGFDGGGFVIAIGADTPVGGLDTLGVTASVASARYDEQEGEDFPFNRLTYAVGAYAAERIGAVRLDGRVAYGVTSSESERSVVLIARDEDGNATGVGDVQRQVEGNWDGSEISAYGRVLYEGRYGAWDVHPFVSLDYLRLEEDAYEETGGLDDAVALGVDEREAESLRGNVGVVIGREFALRPNRFDTTIPGAIAPRLTAAYSTELSGDDLEGTYRFLQGDQDDGDAFTLAAEKEGGVGILGADIVYENQYAKLSGGASVAVGDQSEVYTLRLGVGLKW